MQDYQLTFSIIIKNIILVWTKENHAGRCSVAPKFITVLKELSTGAKKASPGLREFQRSHLLSPLLRQLRTLMSSAPCWRGATAVGHPEQSRYSGSFHSFQHHFSSCRSSAWFWIIVLVVSLQQNFKVFFRKARQYNMHRFGKNISFTLPPGALPYFLCMNWGVQVGHKYNSLTLTELHHSPSAEHLAYGA